MAASATPELIALSWEKDVAFEAFVQVPQTRASNTLIMAQTLEKEKRFSVAAG